MRLKKSQREKKLDELDPEWIQVVTESLIYKNIEKLSDNQKKMLRDLYLENLKYNLKPKEAMEKALQIVLCFKL